MASTKVTFVTGTAEVRRKDLNCDSYNSQRSPEQRLTTEPNIPLQVNYIDGKCTCCPYGYHIDLDFLNFCRNLERGSALKNLKRIQRTKRKLRKSMEMMLGDHEGGAPDSNSTPPDVVHSTEVGRLMHMINYERSATQNILHHIDASVNFEKGSRQRYISSDSDESSAPYNSPHGALYPLDESDHMTTSYSTLERSDSCGSLSTASSVSSETPLHQQLEQQQLYHHTAEAKTMSKFVENPVLEMGTAEMKHYSTSSSAQLAGSEVKESSIRLSLDKKPTVPVNTPPVTTVTFQPTIPVKTPPVTPVKMSLPTLVNTPPATIPKTTPDMNQMPLQSVHEVKAVSLQRMKELEEQIKAIPILQVRISVLKEEKRLLSLQLKASKTNIKPSTSSVGVGDGRVDVVEKMEQSVHSPRTFEFPKSYLSDSKLPSQKSPLVKSPPLTLPKPARTFSVGVGDHSVTELYNLQSDLSTGYTVQENETHSRTILEQTVPLNRLNIPSLNMSFQNSPNVDTVNREVKTSTLLNTLPDSSHIVPDSSQPHFIINQIQRSTPKPLTRTIGTGDGNVLDGSGLHVHEKELRTVIIGPASLVAKRNVGIECRVPTRDVGVSFMCDEGKPETRTVGVNVSYDTSGILTSLDFKGETQLRLALRDVLQRNVRSVATNCNFKPPTVENYTVTDHSSGVSIGCGDEDHRVDVEVRSATVKKSVAIVAKPETGNKCVSTEAGWVLDVGTNTYQVDTYHKSVMTDKLKQMFASTNTEVTPSHHALCQTEYNMLVSLEQVKHAASNTEHIQKYSTGVSTDVIITVSTGVNTTERTNIFQESSEQKNIVKTKELKSILKKSKTVDSALGNGRIDNFHVTSDISKMTQSTFSANETAVPKIQSEYIRKSIECGRNDLSSFKVSQSTPVTQDFVSSREELLSSSQEDLEKRNSAFARVSPTKSEDRFSETVVEHYLITKDGKKLISEEKTTISSLGTNKSFKKYSEDDNDFWLHQQEINSNHGSHNMSSSCESDMHSTSSSSNNISSRVNGSTVTGNYASVINNPYMTVDNLAAVSSILDSELIDNGLEVRYISKTVSQDDLYRENREKKSQLEKISSREIVYDIRRAGSVEDFMPDDIRRYMSIDPSASKDSGFGEDLIQRFCEEMPEPQSSSGDVASSSTSGIKNMETSKTVTTKHSSKSGNKVLVQETKTVQGPDGQITSVFKETTVDDETEQVGISDPHNSSLKSQDEIGMLTSSSRTHSSNRFSGQGGSDSNLSFNIANKPMFADRGAFNASGTKSFSETTIAAVCDSDEELIAEIGSYGSLDRKAGKLKSIMKRRSSDSQQISSRKGITFAESVTGGTGSSSQEEDNTSDSDSTTSYEEGSYDGQQGQVIYYCKDDEAIAQGLPGAQMFDQNIRETYELPNEVREACTVLATYLVDSTSIQSKQLNSCQNIIQQEWFQVSSHKLSVVHQVEDFLSSVNEISKRLLEYIINMTDTNGNTAIHYCVSHCNFEIASLLLDSEVCDINKQNKAGYTPIMLAGLATLQSPDQREVVRRLFSLGDVNARAVTTQQTALMLAASHGRTEMVKLLVEENADINLQDEDGSTALMCACEHGYLDIVNFLLVQPNIDANITDNENSTALSIAMEAGHKDVGVVLYKHLNFSKAINPASHKKKRSSPPPSSYSSR